MKDKVVLLNYTGRHGGGAVYSYEAAKALISSGVKIVAILSSGLENINLWKRLPFHKLIVIKTYSTKISFIINTIFFVLFGRKTIKRQLKGMDIIGIYVPMIAYWTSMINRAAGKNISIYLTIHDPLQHSADKRINKTPEKLAKDAYKVIILSSVFKDYVMRTYGKKEDDIIVAPHGRVNYYKTNFPQKPAQEYGGKINFLFFGRIEEYKGIKILSEAFNELKKKYCNITLTIAGSGNFSKYADCFGGDLFLHNYWIKDEDVGGFFIGNNIVLVLPYLDATQSGVIAIAKEYLVPIIASNTGGMSEQIKNGRTGLLVKPNDSKSLYDAMEFSVNNDCSFLAEEAFKELEAYNWDKVLETLIKELKGIK